MSHPISSDRAYNSRYLNASDRIFNHSHIRHNDFVVDCNPVYPPRPSYMCIDHLKSERSIKSNQGTKNILLFILKKSPEYTKDACTHESGLRHGGASEKYFTRTFSVYMYIRVYTFI